MSRDFNDPLFPILRPVQPRSMNADTLVVGPVVNLYNAWTRPLSPAYLYSNRYPKEVTRVTSLLPEWCRLDPSDA